MRTRPPRGTASSFNGWRRISYLTQAGRRNKNSPHPATQVWAFPKIKYPFNKNSKFEGICLDNSATFFIPTTSLWFRCKASLTSGRIQRRKIIRFLCAGRSCYQLKQYMCEALWGIDIQRIEIQSPGDIKYRMPIWFWIRFTNWGWFKI